MLIEDEVRHLKVLRLKPGDRIAVFDQDGRNWEAELLSIGKNAELKLIKEIQAPKLEMQIAIATAIPKGWRADWLIEKLTELGVARIIPLIAKRSTVLPSSKKIQRWRRIAIEAAKQCGRADLPKIDQPKALDEILNIAKDFDVAMFAHPGAKALQRPTPKSCLICIGPEGGFTQEEIQKLIQAGFKPVGLGPLILRIETAAIAAAVLATCE